MSTIYFAITEEMYCNISKINAHYKLSRNTIIQGFVASSFEQIKKNVLDNYFLQNKKSKIGICQGEISDELIANLCTAAMSTYHPIGFIEVELKKIFWLTMEVQEFTQ